MGTLANLAATRRDLWVVCTRCSNYARFTLRELLVMCGYQTTEEQALRRFRCNVCGAKVACFRYTRPTLNFQRYNQYKAK